MKHHLLNLLLALAIVSVNIAGAIFFRATPVQAASDAFNYFLNAENIEITPTTAGSWQAVDVDAYVPYDATGVIVEVWNEPVTNSNVGLRMYGSTDDRTFAIYNDTHFWACIGILYNQWLQIYVESTSVHIYLVGWTGPGVSYFQNAYNYTLGAEDAWTDIDTSANVPAGAIGLIWEMADTYSAIAEFGLRKNGSTDDHRGTIAQAGYEDMHFWAIIGCDTSRIVEAYVQNAAMLDSFFLTGYVTSGAVFNTNATVVTPAAAGEYQNITLPAGANGALLEVTTTNNTPMGLRASTSTDTLVAQVKRIWGVCASVSRIFQAKVMTDVSYHRIALVGYSIGSDPPTPTPAPTPTSSPTPTPTPGAAYSIKLKITNGCTVTQGASGVPLALANSQLVTAGLIDADGLDTSVKEVDGTFREYTLRNAYINVYVPSLAAGASKEYTYYTGYYPPQTYFHFVPGDTGYVTTADNASLEPGAANFTVEWKGYFDATKTGDIAYKTGEYGLTVSVAGTVSAFVNAVELTAAVTSGEHEILLSRVGATATLYVDDVSKDSDTVTDPSDTAGTIISSENGPAIYTEYTTIAIGGTTVLNYQPVIIIAATTLDDSSASSNDGTITWGSVPVCYTSTINDRTPPPAPTPRPPSQDIILPVGPTPAAPSTPTFPLFKIFSDVAGIGGIPWQWLVIPLLLAVVVILAYLSYKWTGQMWVSAIVAGLVMCAGIPMGVFPFWIGVLVGVFLGAVVLVKATVLH